MPDIHWGYGFCIGGVCATDPAAGGVISPGGVGYDINCGVRLMRTDLEFDDVQPRLQPLVEELFRQVPGRRRAGEGRLSLQPRRAAPTDGRRSASGSSRAAVRRRAISTTPRPTAGSRGASLTSVSARALERGRSQCGTLGAGNHFLEVQVVDQVFDAEAAAAMGLREGQVCVMIHSGSRGLGYQVCDDSLRELRNAPAKYGIALPDRQLVCARSTAPKGSSIWVRCGPRPITPGATGNS